MVKKRIIFFGMVIITSFILQFIAISCFVPVKSDHDIEFDYVYKWKLNGKTGDYYAYDEKMTATGHYVVDFEGDVANVVASVSWEWRATYEGGYWDSARGADEYIFKFSLVDGRYIGNATDQDVYSPNMGVWFYIPNIESVNTQKILTADYQKSNTGVIWVRSLSPQMGIKFTSIGTVHRNNEYGDMDVTYKSEYFFTDEGYLLGEIYSESNTGLSGGYHSTFDVSSKVFVTSSNYGRTMNWFYYFLAYWLPIICVYGYSIALKNYNVRRKKFIKYGNAVVEFQSDVDLDLLKPENMDFSSFYRDLIPAFVWRTYRQGGKVFSITDDNKLKGLALIDSGGKVGTLFGKYQHLMVNQTRVAYYFSETTRKASYSIIDRYDILKISDLPSKSFDYDAFIIKPLEEKYFLAVVDLISKEDYGKSQPEVLKWVDQAISNEIAYVAVGKMDDPWVKEILNALETKKFPPPEAVGDEVIMGVGFAVFYQETGWLYGLYVHPAFRNSGIGRNLALARLSALKEMGVKEALTEIAEWNGPAKKIYAKFDAKILGKIHLIGKKKPVVRIKRR